MSKLLLKIDCFKEERSRVTSSNASSNPPSAVFLSALWRNARYFSCELTVCSRNIHRGEFVVHSKATWSSETYNFDYAPVSHLFLFHAYNVWCIFFRDGLKGDVSPRASLSVRGMEPSLLRSGDKTCYLQKKRPCPIARSALRRSRDIHMQCGWMQDINIRL